jgi:hypothetical protein
MKGRAPTDFLKLPTSIPALPIGYPRFVLCNPVPMKMID